MKFVFILLGIAITGIFLLGRYLLWIFGEEYARNSFEVLSILVLGSIPFALNALYAAKSICKENPLQNYAKLCSQLVREISAKTRKSEYLKTAEKRLEFLKRMEGIVRLEKLS